MDRETFIQKTTDAKHTVIPCNSLIGYSNSDDGGENQNPEPDANANCLANSMAMSIRSKHGHYLTATKTDVQSVTANTYSIQGASGHDHC